MKNADFLQAFSVRVVNRFALHQCNEDVIDTNVLIPLGYPGTG